MADVFISYAKADNQGREISFIVEKLTSIPSPIDPDSNITVWFDIEGIRTGEHWEEEIEIGIEEAHTVAIFVSPRYFASMVCNQELEYAIELGKKLIPIWVAEIRPRDIEKAINDRKNESKDTAEVNTAKQNFSAIRDKQGIRFDFDNTPSKSQTVNAFLTAIFENARLDDGAAEWLERALAKERKTGSWLFGDDLKEAEKWLREADADPLFQVLKKTRVFIKNSRKASNRRRQMQLSGAGVAIIVIAIASVIAFTIWQNSKSTQSTLLAEKSLQVLNEGFQQEALLLAVESLQYYDEGIYSDVNQKAMLAALNYPVQELTSIHVNGKLKDVRWSFDQSSLIVHTEDALKSYLLNGSEIEIHQPASPIFDFEVGTYEGNVYGWDYSIAKWDSALQSLSETYVSGSPILDLQLNHENTLALLTLQNHKIIVWNLEEDTEVASFQHDGIIHGAKWNKDGTRILSWSFDDTARIWDVLSGNEIARFPNAFTGAEWNRNEDHVLTFSGPFLYIWNVQGDPKLVAELEHQDDVYSHGGQILDLKRIYGAKWDADGSRILSWSAAGTARIWDINDLDNPIILPHKNEVIGASWARDYSHVVTWTGDKFRDGYASAQLWEADSGAPVDIMDHTDSVEEVLWSPANEYFLSYSKSDPLQLWSHEGDYVTKLSHSSPAIGALWHIELPIIVTWSENEIKVWEIVDYITLKDGQSIESLLSLARQRLSKDIANETREILYLSTLDPTDTPTATNTPTATSTRTPTLTPTNNPNGFVPQPVTVISPRVMSGRQPTLVTGSFMIQGTSETPLFQTIEVVAPVAKTIQFSTTVPGEIVQTTIEPGRTTQITVPTSHGQTFEVLEVNSVVSTVAPGGTRRETNEPVSGGSITLDASTPLPTINQSTSITSQDLYPIATQLNYDWGGVIEAHTIDLTGENNAHQSYFASDLSYKNFAMKSTIIWGTDASEDSCGFILRYQDEDNKYLLRINRDGLLWLALTKDNQWSNVGTLREEDFEVALNTSNELQVILLDTKFYIFLNSKSVAVFDDDTFDDGKVGTIVWTLDESDVSYCTFTNTTIMPINEEHQIAKVSVDTAVNVREEPNTNSRQVTVVGEDQYVIVIESNNNWYQIQLADGSHGWIRNDLLEVVD